MEHVQAPVSPVSTYVQHCPRNLEGSGVMDGPRENLIWGLVGQMVLVEPTISAGFPTGS